MGQGDPVRQHQAAGMKSRPKRSGRLSINSDTRTTAITGIAPCVTAYDVCFSNRPFRVKRFQTIHHYSVDVAHGLVLLFGIGTRALPSWDSRTRWNNLSGGLAV